jgi:hypothetical protein
MLKTMSAKSDERLEILQCATRAKIIRSYPSHFLVSSPVALKFLNVVVLKIAEKLLAGR